MSENNTIRVFISSTFRDVHAERDHLVTVVFPEFAEQPDNLCMALSIRAPTCASSPKNTFSNIWNTI